MKHWKGMLSGALALSLMLAGAAPMAGAAGREKDPYVDRAFVTEVELVEGPVVLADGPALPEGTAPVASGTKVAKNSKAQVDYSNTQDGYVMVRFTAQSDKRLRVKVIGPTGTEYQYNIERDTWVTFPLSDGNGSYQVKVYEKKTTDPQDGKYLVALNVTFDVELTDEFAPFLRPNQYVDYGGATNTLAKAAELLKDETDVLKKVEKIYDFVVANLTYDKEKAKTDRKSVV